MNLKDQILHKRMSPLSHLQYNSKLSYPFFKSKTKQNKNAKNQNRNKLVAFCFVLVLFYK